MQCQEQNQLLPFCNDQSMSLLLFYSFTLHPMHSGFWRLSMLNPPITISIAHFLFPLPLLMYWHQIFFFLYYDHVTTQLISTPSSWTFAFFLFFPSTFFQHCGPWTTSYELSFTPLLVTYNFYFFFPFLHTRCAYQHGGNYLLLFPHISHALLFFCNYLFIFCIMFVILHHFLWLLAIYS